MAQEGREGDRSIWLIRVLTQLSSRCLTLQRKVLKNLTPSFSFLTTGLYLPRKLLRELLLKHRHKLGTLRQFSSSRPSYLPLYTARNRGSLEARPTSEWHQSKKLAQNSHSSLGCPFIGAGPRGRSTASPQISLNVGEKSKPKDSHPEKSQRKCKNHTLTREIGTQKLPSNFGDESSERSRNNPGARFGFVLFSSWNNFSFRPKARQIP